MRSHNLGFVLGYTLKKIFFKFSFRMQLLRDVLKAYSIYNEPVGYCQVLVNTFCELYDVDAGIQQPIAIPY